MEVDDVVRLPQCGTGRESERVQNKKYRLEGKVLGFIWLYNKKSINQAYEYILYVKLFNPYINPLQDKVYPSYKRDIEAQSKWQS